MTKPFIAFLVLVMILTAYTIYGGTFTGEQIAIRNYIDNYFNNIAQILGSREFDVLEAEVIKHNIDNIKVDGNIAEVDLKVTGIDNTKLNYELAIYHAFVQELARTSNDIVNLPYSRDVYEFLIRENLNNTKITDLTVQLGKSGSNWRFTDEGEQKLQESLRGTRIELKTLSNKAYDNLNKLREMVNKEYLESGIDIPFIVYWEEYLEKFILNSKYVTEFPFEEQEFTEDIQVEEMETVN